MTKGLTLGKFYPLHLGHLKLIEFAKTQCDILFVLICASDTESIDGQTRLEWIKKSYNNCPNINPILLEYHESELPNTSVSSREVSQLWANKILSLIPDLNYIISSEPYGAYLAEYLQCETIFYDIARTITNISASLIRQHPLRYWDYIADSAKPYFVKKICIYGSESTGKSTLTVNLAQYFKTNYVPEMAREVIEKTEECTLSHLEQIASLHAKTILEKTPLSNKILIVDTDVNITNSYAKFLFNKELLIDDWIKQANTFDLYLFLDIDAPFVQDGTRLEKEDRLKLHFSHKQELASQKIDYILLSGDWDNRFQQAVDAIQKLL